MAHYVRLYENQEQYAAERSGNYFEPWLSLTVQEDRVDYNKTEEEKLLGMPLTFEIVSDGNIVWRARNAGSTKTIEYKKNDGEWTEITSATGNSAPSISVVSGDTVQFRGNNATYSDENGKANYFSGTTCSFNLKGNIMSLISADNYSTLNTFESAITFSAFFVGCPVVSAENLILPASELIQGCYRFMFSGCTSLISAPNLKALNLANECYYFMFANCTSLSSVQNELPALSGYSLSYCAMFSGCTSLVTAPEISMTYMASSDICKYMFAGCTGLTTGPSILPALTASTRCYQEMFKDCWSLATVPVLPATNLFSECYKEMFYACYSLTTAQEILPATTLASSCYTMMFGLCSGLTTAPILPAETLVNNCYYGMFSDCESLTYIKCLATDISANMCTADFHGDVPASGTFVKHPLMSSWTVGYNGIPTGWTVVDDPDVQIGA